MFEYHATYGASKKIIKSESNLCKDIYGPIKKVFSLDRECSLHMQYWHTKYNDWVDCEESDKISDGSKLNVFLNLYSIPDIPYSSSLSTLSSPSAEIRCSTPSSSFSSPVHEECPPFDQQPSHQMDCEEFPHVYILPAFPPWCQTLLEECSPKCKEARCRRAVVDALFDDLLPYGQYPTSRMFQETARALVEAYPILKDQHIANAQPHDSWVLRLRDKFKKFRSRHADELSNAEEVQKMKAKFGGKRHNLNLEVENSLDNSLTPVKRMKVQDLSEWEEDQFSIDVHIKELREECQKRKPNADLIQDKMARTFTYRVSYITTHSVAETLNCFPPLKQTNELIIEGMRLGVTEADMKQFLIQKKTSLLHLAQNRKEKNNKVSQLLTAQAECACTEDGGLAFLALLLPSLLTEKSPLLFVEENVEISVVKPLIVYRQSVNVFQNSFYELFLDKIYITKTEDLVTAITLWFTLFWIFDVGYSKDHVKFLSFLDTFIFKKCSLKQVPRSIKSFFNAL